MPQDDNKTDEGLEKRKKIGYWLKWLKAAKKASKDHWEDSRAAYREDELAVKRVGEEQQGKKGYPLYHFSCETLRPAYYARTPKVIAKRKYGIEDETALTMALIAERLGQYVVDYGHFDEAMTAARDDFINAGKATTQVIYDAYTSSQRMPLMLSQDGATYIDQGGQPYSGEVLEDDEGAYYESSMLDEESQKLYLAPCPFDEILHTPNAKSQCEITEIAYRFCLDKEEAERKFNPDGTKALSYKEAADSEDDGKEDDEKKYTPGKQLEGWEIYCLKTKTIYWVSEDYEEDFLATEPDELGIKGFFPSPSFILQNKHRKTMFTTPVWVYLEPTANQLHALYEKVFQLIVSIRRRALVYGASSELITALNSLDGQEFIAAGDLQDLLDKGGLQNLILWVPVQELVQALTEVMQLEEHFKNLFYEWFGVPDILRGVSDPAETAEAQGIKSDAAHDRFKYAKKQMIDLARDSAQMLLDVALKVYSDEKIARICGYQYLQRGTPEIPAQPPSEQNPQGVPGEPAKPGHYEKFIGALQRLRDDTERIITIDFETDSTSFRDEARDIQRAQVISQTLINGLATIGGMQNLEFMDLATQSLLAVLESMGGTSQTEDMIKAATAQLEKRRNQPAPPPPDVDMLKLEVEKQKLQLEVQDMDIKRQAFAVESQVKAREQDRKDFDSRVKAQTDAAKNQLEAMKLELNKVVDQFAMQIEAGRLQLEQFEAKARALESQMEEARLAKDTEVAAIRELLIAKNGAEQKEPQVITVAPPAMPPITVNVQSTKPGKKLSNIQFDEFGNAQVTTEEMPEVI